MKPCMGGNKLLQPTGDGTTEYKFGLALNIESCSRDSELTLPSQCLSQSLFIFPSLTYEMCEAEAVAKKTH